MSIHHRTIREDDQYYAERLATDFANCEARHVYPKEGIQCGPNVTGLFVVGAVGRFSGIR